MSPHVPAMSPRTSVVVAVCTYNRNELLRSLLEGLIASASEAAALADVGVVIVDDSADANARAVVVSFEGRFALGVHYRQSGKQNISLARNLALDTALPLAEWVAMTDDDCEPVVGWLRALLETQARTGADAVTGPMHLRVPPGSPSWLEEQPFFADQLFGFRDGAETDTAATNNSMLRSSFLLQRPELRFWPELGVVGGEDMVFYRSAHRAGLRIVYCESAAVWGNETPERATYKHQLTYRFWLGNTEYVTCRSLNDATPFRLFLRGANRLRAAIMRPFTRLAHRQPPQWRYALAAALRGVGMMIGPFGVRLRHH